MDIQLYQLLCYTVEEKSISGAAKRAFLSQPAVSKKIKQMEEHYNCLLFDRNTNSLTVTPAGKKLYHFAKNILKEYEESKAVIESMTNLRKQTVRAGSSYTLGEYILPEVISAFKKEEEHPDVKLAIHNTPYIINELNERNLDIVFVEGDIGELNVNKEIIAEDEIILIAPPDHPWTKRMFIHAEELFQECLISREEESGTRQITEQYLNEWIHINQFTKMLEFGTTQAIKTAVQSGLGVAFVSKQTVKNELKTGLLKEVKVKGLQIHRPLWVATSVDRFQKESTTLFKNFAIHYLKKKHSIIGD